MLLEQKVKELEHSNDKFAEENAQRYAEWNDKESRLLMNIVEAEKQASEYIARHECAVKQLQTSSMEEEKLTEVIAELRASNHDREIKIRLLDKELKFVKHAEYEQQIKKLNSKINELVVKNDLVSKRVEELLEQKEMLSCGIETKDRMNRDLLDQVSSACGKCEELEQAVGEHNEGMLKLQTMNTELRSMVEGLEANKIELISQLESLEKETSSLQEEVSQKEHAYATVHSSDTPLEYQNCGEQRDQILSLSGELDALKCQMAKTELEKAELSQKHELLTREYDESLSDIAEKEKVSFRQETEISEFKKSMKSVDIILRKQELMIDDLEEKLKVSLEDNLKLNYEMKCLQDTPQVPEDSKADAVIPKSPSASDETSTSGESDTAELDAEVDEADPVEMDEKLEEALVSEASPVLTKASSTLTRLKSLVQEGEEIHNIVESTKEVQSTVINKVFIRLHSSLPAIHDLHVSYSWNTLASIL